jgi:hypothetical protein
MTTLASCVLIAARYPACRSTCNVTRHTIKAKLDACCNILENYMAHSMIVLTSVDKFYIMYFIGSISIGLRQSDNLFEFTERELARIQARIRAAACVLTNTKKCYRILRNISTELEHAQNTALCCHMKKEERSVGWESIVSVLFGILCGEKTWKKKTKTTKT